MSFLDRFKGKRKPKLGADESRPTTRQYLDATGHHDFMHPVDHALPQGTVNRGDEMVWVITRIELHADAGTLDDGTSFILDAQINHRNAQWDDAATQFAAKRRRTAGALQAEEAEHLTGLLEQLRDLRASHAATVSENDHWRHILLGARVTNPPHIPRDLTSTAANTANAASTGITIANPTTASTRDPWSPVQPHNLTAPHHDTHIDEGANQ